MLNMRTAFSKPVGLGMTHAGTDGKLMSLAARHRRSPSNSTCVVFPLWCSYTVNGTSMPSWLIDSARRSIVSSWKNMRGFSGFAAIRSGGIDAYFASLGLSALGARGDLFPRAIVNVLSDVDGAAARRTAHRRMIQ